MGIQVREVASDAFADPARKKQVFDLLDLGWPALASRAQHAEELGFSWARLSRPFAVFRGSRAIAHAGVVEMEALLAGERRRFVGIHAVCTRPEYRGQGWCRAVMEEALAWCDERYETVILFTELLELYERFGFRRIFQHRFATEVDPQPGRPGFRALSGRRPADMELLRQAVSGRAPLSAIYGPLGGAELFGLNEVLMRRRMDRIFWCQELELAAAFDLTGAVLRLYDIAGPRIPPLMEIVRRAGSGIRRVEAWFAPDLLHSSFRVLGDALAGDQLMARGPLAAEDHAFMVPLHARC